MHVADVALDRADDEAVWAYAAKPGLTIVSKDNDFRQMSFLRGPPPKVIWLAVGNAPTAAIAAILHRHRDAIIRFIQSDEALLVLS